ncbi:MAG TPA: hypothetical protein VE010_05500 [Thermoanaerobaculia bacterium]|nr:hypothetical protein [Thermoanaerobaculia bacterium]
MAAEPLLGVYTSMPDELPAALHGRDVVIAGGNIDAALRLADCCSSVTLITPRTARLSVANHAKITILYGSEIVCIDGLEQVESVVVRKIRTRTISARSAAGVFLLHDHG